jgi:hypothetical protein
MSATPHSASRTFWARRQTSFTMSIRPPPFAAVGLQVILGSAAPATRSLARPGTEIFGSGDLAAIW